MPNGIDLSFSGLGESGPTFLEQPTAALVGRCGNSLRMAMDRAALITSPREAAGAPGFELYLRQAAGARVVDVDGNTLLDLCMGYGAQLLGHGHPAVTQAMARQVADGWQLGLPGPAHLELAQIIQSASPANERVSFCASGSDASLLAMRAARAVTGKEAIGVFAGSFHGMHDYGLVSGEADLNQGVGSARKVHLGAGIPRVVDQVVSVLPYGHPAAFDQIRRQRSELAAIVVEAVRPDDPHLDAGPWLRELAGICRQTGVLFILDETSTGFRLGFGGAQEAFNLKADYVTYGKAVGGGLPLGVVAGRAELMRVFAGEPGGRGIFAASGFAGNALSISAALGALDFVAANRHHLYVDLDARTARLADGFAAAAAAIGVPAAVRRAGSIIRIVLGPAHPRPTAAAAHLRRLEDRFAQFALRRGVLLQAGLRGHVSTAHTDADIDLAVDALAAALTDLQHGGTRLD